MMVTDRSNKKDRNLKMKHKKILYGFSSIAHSSIKYIQIYLWGLRAAGIKTGKYINKFFIRWNSNEYHRYQLPSSLTHSSFIFAQKSRNKIRFIRSSKVFCRKQKQTDNQFFFFVWFCKQFCVCYIFCGTITILRFIYTLKLQLYMKWITRTSWLRRLR